jgi:hypothetical protein
MPEMEFEIARKIGASWKSSARIRRLEFRVALNFRVNPASSRVKLSPFGSGSSSRIVAVATGSRMWDGDAGRRVFTAALLGSSFGVTDQ